MNSTEQMGQNLAQLREAEKSTMQQLEQVETQLNKLSVIKQRLVVQLHQTRGGLAALTGEIKNVQTDNREDPKTKDQ